MRSMTGYGVGAAPFGDSTMSVELRSLNHRYLDVRVRLPAELLEHAFFFEQHCRAQLGRGRFDVSARVEGPPVGQAGVNHDAALRLFRELSAVRDRVAPEAEVPLSLLGAFPELLTAGAAPAPEQARETLVQAFTAALTELDRMRNTEGQHLGQELRSRLTQARFHLDELKLAGPRLAIAYEQRLRQRLRKLVGELGSVDESRLLTELAMLAERSDITEEIVRFESHCAQFEGLLDGVEPCGRKLDFLLQEMSREVNTIGAKCHDGDASARVVELKAELERLREQVQNVE